MALLSLSKEKKDELLKQRDAKIHELETLRKKTPKDLWVQDLDTFMDGLKVIMGCFLMTSSQLLMCCPARYLSNSRLWFTIEHRLLVSINAPNKSKGDDNSNHCCGVR